MYRLDLDACKNRVRKARSQLGIQNVSKMIFSPFLIVHCKFFLADAASEGWNCPRSNFGAGILHFSLKKQTKSFTNKFYNHYLCV